MEQSPTEITTACEIEILPPDREDCRDHGTVCVCCGWARSFLDPDGCGICEECLAS